MSTFNLNRLPVGYYGIELFSGHGSVGRIASKVLGIPVFTVDISERFGKPTFLQDISKPGQVIRNVKQYAAERHLSTCAFIWASVPCPEYSQAKTVGVRNLESADALVQATRQIYLTLRALLLIIENPGTGLLADRDVISFIPKQNVYDLDYCQYGFCWQKHTRLFCTQQLPNFQPKQCPNHCQRKQLQCEAAYVSPDTGEIGHIWEMGELKLGQRIAVPDRLVNQVCQSVLLLLCRSAATATATALLWSVTPAAAVDLDASAAAPTTVSDSLQLSSQVALTSVPSVEYADSGTEASTAALAAATAVDAFAAATTTASDPMSLRVYIVSSSGSSSSSAQELLTTDCSYSTAANSVG